MATPNDSKRTSNHIDSFPCNFGGFSSFTRPIPVRVPAFDGELFAEGTHKVIKNDTAILARVPKHRERVDVGDDIEGKTNSSASASNSSQKGTKRTVGKVASPGPKRVTRQSARTKKAGKKEFVFPDDEDFE